MDPKLIFWTASLANLAAVCVFALLGVRYVRRGEIARHQHAMKIASFLVLAFLGAYVLKLQFLGRENMAVWNTRDTWVLRIHELFVLQMVIAGGIAWFKSQRLIGTRLVTRNPADPVPAPKDVRIHRVAGRAAVIGALLGFVLAIGVLAGMYARSSAA